MIEEEDAKHPLTDDHITARLQAEGIDVTRRTVAKYREDMKIPSTHQRGSATRAPAICRRWGSYMKVTYTGRQMDLSPAQSGKLTAEFDKVGKLLDNGKGEAEAHVVLSHERHLNNVEDHGAVPPS